MAVLRWQPIALARDNADYFKKRAQMLLTAMQEDLNSPGALASLSSTQNKLEAELVTTSELEAFEHLLNNLDTLFGLDLMQQSDITAEQKQLVVDRTQAREAKDWTTSDTLRSQLAEQGIAVRDTAYGPIWYRT